MLKEKLKDILKKELSIQGYSGGSFYDENFIEQFRGLSKKYGEESVVKACSELDGKYIHLILYLAISGNYKSEKYLRESIEKHPNNEVEKFVCALGLLALYPKNKSKIFEDIGYKNFTKLNISNIKYESIEDTYLKEIYFQEKFPKKGGYHYVTLRQSIIMSYPSGQDLNQKLLINSYKMLSNDNDEKEVARICFDIDERYHSLIMYLAIAGNKETEPYIRLILDENKEDGDVIFNCAIGLIALNIEEGVEILEQFAYKTHPFYDGSDLYDIYDFLRYVYTPKGKKMKEDIVNQKYGKFNPDYVENFS